MVRLKPASIRNFIPRRAVIESVALTYRVFRSISMYIPPTLSPLNGTMPDEEAGVPGFEILWQNNPVIRVVSSASTLTARSSCGHGDWIVSTCYRFSGRIIYLKIPFDRHALICSNVSESDFVECSMVCSLEPSAVLSCSSERIVLLQWARRCRWTLCNTRSYRWSCVGVKF